MQEDIYINLIYKKLSGEISSEETQALNAWLEQAEENRHTLESITAAWGAADTLKPNVTVNLEDEFIALDQRIEEDEKSDPDSATIRQLKPEVNKSSWRIWQIAAGMIFLIGGFFLIRNANQPLGTGELVKIKSLEEIKSISLPDGSKITLNKSSSLSYFEDLSGEKRAVTLTGEAFFEVSHNPEKPFVIDFDQQIVEVLGTSFNIKTTSSKNEVSLISGKVKWTDATDGEEIIMNPGMIIQKDKITGQINIEKSGAINNDYWQDQQLDFEETTLSDVLEILEEIFDVQFSEIPLSLMQCRFTSNFKQPTLENILEVLSTVFGLEVIQVSPKKYQLKGGACQ